MERNDDIMRRDADAQGDVNSHARWMPGYKEEETDAEIPVEPKEELDIEKPEAPDEQPAPAPQHGNGGILEKVSLTLSGVFSPLLVPTYACAIALWITPLAILSERTRLLLSLVIFIFTAAIPMGTILFLMRTGRVKDSAISDRSERTVPYVVSLLCYMGTALYLWVRHAPLWLSNFFGGAAVAIVFALLINNMLKWKISAHGTCMGGLCAMVFFIASHHIGIVSIMSWLIGAFLLAGAVGSARLYLNRHTPWQVYAGFLMGFFVEYIAMSL